MSRPDLVIGVDVGSGSTKATVFDLDGRVHGQGRMEYSPHLPAPGVAEYEVGDLCTAAERAISDAIASVDRGRLAGLAVAAMMSGAAAIDARGAALTPYTTTLDTRFADDLERLLRVAGPRIRALTGSGQPTLGPKIAWLERSVPGLAIRVARYTLAGDLVARHLGEAGADDSFIDPTYLWTTGLGDVARMAWSAELLAEVPVALERLPRIIPSTEMVGRVGAAVARRTGLPQGMPIVAGCGDQAAGYLGAGVGEAGRGADSAGTYSVFAGVSGQFRPSPEEAAPDVVASAIRGRFHVQSMVIGGGLTRAWAAGLLAGDDGSAEVALDELAAGAPPGSNGVTFVPHLGGQAYPPRPWLRGSWLGMTWAHSRGDLFRAVLESIAFEEMAHIVRMERLHPDVAVTSVVVYGGGATSRAWNQIKSDALGVPFDSIGEVNATALGAALVAAEGVGLIGSAADQAARIVRVVDRVEPDPVRHATYRRLLPAYQDAVESEATRGRSDAGASV